MIAKKKKRLIFVLAALSFLTAATLLILTGLRDNIVFFYSPSELSRPEIAVKIKDREFRLGGMVEIGSIKTSQDGVQTAFTVTDRKATQQVQYTGILPDLFSEGEGVIVTGRLSPEGDLFFAREVLAKHDENYMPPELQKKLDDAHQKAD